MENLVVSVKQEEQDRLKQEILPYVKLASSIVIASKEDVQKADKVNVDIKEKIKQIDAVFKPIADKAFQTHRAITSQWNETKKPLVEASDIITRKVRQYIAEEKRKAEEIAYREEMERRLKKAMELKKNGKEKDAEEVIDMPVEVKVNPDTVPKYDARVYKAPVSKARVVNLWELIQFVAKNKDCVDYLLPNEKVLNQVAKKKGKQMDIPGVEYYEE